jgi:Ca2+:H+ antiporter
MLYVLFLYFQLWTHASLFEPDADAHNDEENDDERIDQTLASFAVLIIATIGIVICTHLLLDSIDATSKQTGLTRRFIAAIFVPLASNAPEFITIFVITRRGRIDYVIGVIAGSILQIALLVIPLLVMLGWMLGKPMTLNFETFQIILLFFSLLGVNRLLKDDGYTYLQGLMLVEM